MAVDLTTIFGAEINIFSQPRQPQRQYASYAGAHGLTALYMGTRGYSLVVSGTLRATGISYNAARATLQAAINALNDYTLLGADSYTYRGITYDNMIFEQLKLVPDARGKVFHLTAGGYVTCNFTCMLRSLI